jgi:hypothetical protein
MAVWLKTGWDFPSHPAPDFDLTVFELPDANKNRTRKRDRG